MSKSILKTISLCLVISLIIFPISIFSRSNIDPPLSNNVETKQSSSYEPIDQIIILSNQDFIDRGFPGLGTIENPFIIEGYEISSLGDSLLIINNVDAYFIIRDNLFSGENSNNAGISISNVENGVFENNVITKARKDGIQIYNSRNIIIQDNEITENNERGILLDNTFNIQVLGNLIDSNRFEGVGSYNSNNNIWRKNSIINNIENGIRLEIGELNLFESNIVTGNTASGIWLGQAHNNIIQNNVFRGSNTGISITHDDVTGISTNNVIFQNEILSNFDGIFIWQGELNNITQNIINFNWINGINFEDAPANIIKNNIISNSQNGLQYSGISYLNDVRCNLIEKNSNGIHIKNDQGTLAMDPNTRRNDITMNIIKDNEGYGLNIASGSYIEIIKNDFLDNLIPQARDQGRNNTFDNNHWSDLINLDLNEDGISDDLYQIEGDSSFDYFPSIQKNVLLNDSSVCNIIPASLFGSNLNIVQTGPELVFPISLASILLITALISIILILVVLMKKT